MEVVVMEGIGLAARTLFKIETVVLDVGLHAGLIHEAVVFFGPVARVCDGCMRRLSAADVRIGQERS